jgi:hypothetical protein
MMYLSISLDALPEQSGPEAFRTVCTRADRIEAAQADVVLLAREMPDGGFGTGRVEAMVQLPWLAGRIRSAALIAAVPALHSIPFHVARALSTIDFLSDGRSGWMPLASNTDRHDSAYGSRYRLEGQDVADKATDFIRATHALLDSWDDDALVLDKASGVYLSANKVRRVDYRGPFFSTMGPLNAARPPQGHPLLVRDLDDMPPSDIPADIPADIVIGTIAALARAEAPIKLIKVAEPGLDEALAAVAAGSAHGLHLMGIAAIDHLERLRARYPRIPATGATARLRLGLARPANPFSQQAAA